MDRQFVIKGSSPGEARLGSPATVHEQLTFLNEASRRIGSTLDMRETARELMDVVVPRFADASVLMVQDRLLGDGETAHRSGGDDIGPVRRIAMAVAHAGADDEAGPDDYATMFPLGASTTYPSWTPYARCMATARPIMFTIADPEMAAELGQYIGRAGADRLLDNASILLVPLRARGRVLGVTMFTRRPASPPFEEEDVALGEELVGRTALCIDNALLYDRERGTALALQSSLLPAELYQPPGVEIATRYLPASDLTGVGGDWYDTIPLAGCRVALVVGDVMGHGTRAAATMGQLRTAARTLAALDLTPDEVLLQLSRMSQDLDATQIATCVYAVYDPVTRRCAIARAGHVPPILLHPDGATEIIELPAGLPLGIGSEPFQMKELTLPVDGVLALYTDGLVESRDRDIDEGIGTLRNLLSVRLRDLEDICDATLNAQRRGDERDDIALLLARVRDLTPEETRAWTFPAEPSMVREARRLVRVALAEWGLPVMRDNSELLVSELLTNAVSHARAPIEVRLMRGRSLVIEVTDGSFAAPVGRTPGLDDDGGRGLQLVNRLAYRWGTRRTASGKVVWAEQRMPSVGR
jgi:anti-sigma regulatory factor (Ser/Thr protein kinase)